MSGCKGRFKGFRGFGTALEARGFAALPDRRLVLTPDMKALLGISACFRKVFSINKKVCAGPGCRSGRHAGVFLVRRADPAELVQDLGKQVEGHRLEVDRLGGGGTLSWPR